VPLFRRDCRPIARGGCSGTTPPEPARRLLLWIMSGLDLGEYVDVVALSRTFLASDLDATSAEASEAYRVLCEAGVLERADYLPAPENSDSFLVRVTLLGNNETKYPRPFQPEAFGPAPYSTPRRCLNHRDQGSRRAPASTAQGFSLQVLARSSMRPTDLDARLEALPR
jgi:hypothetical protein